MSTYIDSSFLKVGIVNDKTESIEGKLRLQLIDFNGNVLWKKKIAVKVPAISSKVYFDINRSDFLKNKDSRSLLLVVELIKNEDIIASNYFYFHLFMELNIPSPKITHSLTKTDKGFEIKIKTDKLAKNVFIEIGDEEGFFSDNYFDLLPEVGVIVLLKTGLSEDRLKEVLSIRTLKDAF